METEIKESEIKKYDYKEPLISDSYTYENMINNPIIKPIAEIDRSISDIDEIIWKRMDDLKKDKGWINESMLSVPAYSDSNFVARLIKLVYSAEDIIKLEDIQIKNLKNCIREIVEIVRNRYGVKIDEYTEKEIEGREIKSEINYYDHLKELMEKSEKNVKEVVKEIIDLYEGYDDEKWDTKKRFQTACIDCYDKEKKVEKKKIIAKIIRREL